MCLPMYSPVQGFAIPAVTEAVIIERQSPRFRWHPPSIDMLLPRTATSKLLLVRRRLLFLHMLLHALLVLSNEVRDLGFLISAQQLVNLRRDSCVLDFDLHVSLRFLTRNRSRL